MPQVIPPLDLIGIPFSCVIDHDGFLAQKFCQGKLGGVNMSDSLQSLLAGRVKSLGP